MRPVELGGDMDRKIEVSHRPERHFGIGHRNREVAAKADQGLRATIADRLDSFDSIVALVARRVDSKHAGQSVQELIIRTLGNADRAVSLYIRVTAQRRNAGALASDIAAEHQQISDLLHIARAVAMLGDAHAVIDDDPLSLAIDVANELDI